MAQGRFITFEGGEGAGKSTQLKRLVSRLESNGREVVSTREPGGSPGAEGIRELVLKGSADRWSAVTETLLMYAARRDHLERVIRPALARGAWVVCDRFADSTRVYQGILGKVDERLIKGLERVSIGDLAPDLTIVLDVPVELGLERVRLRRGAKTPDRFEAENVEFHQKLRDAYLAIAAEEPARCVVVDACAAKEAVAKDIWDAVQARLAPPAARRVVEDAVS